MKPEQTHKEDRDVELPSPESTGESKEDREKSFSRRALLMWSLPAVAIAAGVVSPSEAEHWDHSDGPTHDDHGDTPHEDHSDGYGDHDDSYQDYWDQLHTDTPYDDHSDHTDVHEDYSDHGDTAHGDDGVHGDNYTDHDDLPVEEVHDDIPHEDLHGDY